MICKNVSAILRGKDPEVTTQTFINPILKDLKESTQQDEAAQPQQLKALFLKVPMSHFLKNEISRKNCLFTRQEYSDQTSFQDNVLKPL